MHSNFKRAAAAAMVLCMGAAALSGCAKKAEVDNSAKPMVKVGDIEVSQGTSNLILRYQQAQFESGWGGFLRSYYGDIWNVDLTGSGVPYGTEFKGQVVSLIEEMALAKEHMAEYNVEITADEEADIKKAAEEFIASNDEETLKAVNGTVETAQDMLTLYTIRNKVNNAIAAGVDTEVSDEEAAQRTVSYVSFIASVDKEEESEAVAETEGAEAIAETEVKTQAAEETEAPAEAVAEEAVEAVETEAETEEADPAMEAARAEMKAKAEAFLAEAKKTDDFTALADEAAQEDHVNTGSWTFGKDDDYPDAAIIAATEGAEDGTVIDQVFQSGNVFYVVHVDKAFDEDATAEKKEEIVEQRKSDAINEVYTEWSNTETVDVDTEALMNLSYNTLVYLEQETEEAIAETEAVEAGTEAVEK